MYGTVVQVRFRPGHANAGKELTRSAIDERLSSVAGFVGQYLLTPDADCDEGLALVIFDSKEAYERNARDPAQDTWYRHFRELLANDPVWHDGAIVALMPATLPL